MTLHKKAEALTSWLWNSPQKTHNHIYEALVAFAEAERNEASDAKFEAVILAARNAAYEECAKIAEEHAGHGCECAHLIRAIKEAK